MNSETRAASKGFRIAAGVVGLFGTVAVFGYGTLMYSFAGLAGLGGARGAGTVQSFIIVVMILSAVGSAVAFTNVKVASIALGLATALFALLFRDLPLSMITIAFLGTAAGLSIAGYRTERQKEGDLGIISDKPRGGWRQPEAPVAADPVINTQESRVESPLRDSPLKGPATKSRIRLHVDGSHEIIEESYSASSKHPFAVSDQHYGDVEHVRIPDEPRSVRNVGIFTPTEKLAFTGVVFVSLLVIFAIVFRTPQQKEAENGQASPISIPSTPYFRAIACNVHKGHFLKVVTIFNEENKATDIDQGKCETIRIGEFGGKSAATMTVTAVLIGDTGIRTLSLPVAIFRKNDDFQTIFTFSPWENGDVAN